MNKPDRVIHIACQADARFGPDCAVMLHSLFTANPDEKFEVHFLYHPELAADVLEGLAEICVRFGARWSPLAVADSRMEGFPFVPHYGGYAACYRLLLPELLPQVAKVLYLDADILVVDRIRALWDTPLGTYCVAAVTNPLFAHMVRRITTTLGLADGRDYFNSGVLLLDLDRLRSSGLFRELVAFVREGRAPLVWPDQDPLNAVLWRHRLPLHPRWNATNGIFDLPSRYMPWSRRELDEAKADPAIVHFVGPYKPRHYRLRHPYRPRYFKHLAQTRWRGLPIEGRSIKHMVLRPLPVLWQWFLENAGRTAMRLVRGLATRLKRIWRRTNAMQARS